MANICTNIMKVSFTEKENDPQYAINNAKAFIEKFCKQFNAYFIYPEIFPVKDEEVLIDEEDFYGTLEINFESRWSTPEDYLETCSRDFDCYLLGVSYEWANEYINAFNIDRRVSALDIETMSEIEADRQINLQKDEQNHG